MYSSDDDDDVRFGLTQYFVMYGSCTSAVVRELKPCSGTIQDYFRITTGALDGISKHLVLPVQSTTTFCIVHVDRILEKCVFVEIEGAQYICQFPNHVLVD